MKQTILFTFLSILLSFQAISGQSTSIKKGVITDSVPIGPEGSESMAVFLPKDFSMEKKWPVLFVFESEGRGRQAIGMFQEAAEKEGYILAAPNNVRDSLAIAQNMLVTNRMIDQFTAMLPIDVKRMYTGGFGKGGQLASLVPVFLPKLSGAVVSGAALPTLEVLNDKKPFYFIGIVGKRDFNYPLLRETMDQLDRKKYPNHLFVFDGGNQWPPKSYLEKAFQLFTLEAMEKGVIPTDTTFLENSYDFQLIEVRQLLQKNELLNAYSQMEDLLQAYGGQMELDSLKNEIKKLKKDSRFRAQRREEKNTFFQETLRKEDYEFYLEEDIATYNYNNLGWWKFQMESLDKLEQKDSENSRDLAARLRAYINAYIEDYILIVSREENVDEEALLLLQMMKTITEPGNPEYYLAVISQSAKLDDYGTALFYLEELLKTGYRDQEVLYNLEHTALLRITPEFNAIIAEYFKDARYEIIEE
ncbi:MAG: alpha/beta hydrolase [Flavobacteriaceae bacterium]|nr:alpha/beta hydrolase [Flavobacteriaceae bacterium]